MIANNNALRAVTEGKDGILAGLRRKNLHRDEHRESGGDRDCQASEASSAEMLDAPVSGSSITLEEQADLHGRRQTEVFEKSCRIFKPVAQRQPMSALSAAAMKVATNLSLAVQMLAFSRRAAR
jgi:3-hydroxyisobutyrate dehydrogenase-like beta-hydroxyacid dehydrogenase